MPTILRQLLARAVVLGAVAMVAVGVARAVAAALGATVSESYVVGDAPGVHYTAERCADYFEYSPHASTCEQAATKHHFGEVVEYRGAAGVLGALALAGCALVRRRRPALFRDDALPDAFDITVATVAFGIAGAGLLVFGIDEGALGHNGAGGWLSGGIVAALFAIVYAARFVRQISPRRTVALS